MRSVNAAQHRRAKYTTLLTFIMPFHKKHIDFILEILNNINKKENMIKQVLESIIVGVPGSYNMFSLEIEINGKANSQNNSTIFHEYTHYLQNMTTISGFVTLDKYIHVLLASFTKLGSDLVDPKIPLCNYHELQSVLGDKNIYNILKSRSFGMDFDNSGKRYIFQDTDLDDYTISEGEYFDHFSKLFFRIPYIAIDGKNIPLNEIVIKENMALVNTIIASLTSKKLTENDIDEILSYEYKEYNVLFDFINHYLPNCDLLKLVYSLCEISLNLHYFEQILGNILRLIQKEAEELSKMKTDELIFFIKDSIQYDIRFSKLLSIIHERAIKETIALFNGFVFSENQFISIMKDFYNYLINGLKYRKTHETLYIESFSNEYIQNLATVIGNPVIFFQEEKEYKGFSETPEYFFDDFVYLHGALKIFTQLYYCNVLLCPFLQKSICKVMKNKNCYDNCLSNYDDKAYKNCLLSNALICTGIRQVNRHA